MVVISGEGGCKKFACKQCIRGHRVSKCKHSDRPLFEIKPKGRPQTQCSKCRDDRLVNNKHTKCICNNSNNSDGSDSNRPKESSSAGFLRPLIIPVLSTNTLAVSTDFNTNTVIYEPDDDLDSDTPSYRTDSDHSTPNLTHAALGELANIRSEDLLDRLYSRFPADQLNGHDHVQ